MSTYRLTLFNKETGTTIHQTTIEHCDQVWAKWAAVYLSDYPVACAVEPLHDVTEAEEEQPARDWDMAAEDCN